MSGYTILDTRTLTPTDGAGKYAVKARIRNKPAGLATGFATKKFTV